MLHACCLPHATLLSCNVAAQRSLGVQCISFFPSCCAGFLVFPFACLARVLRAFLRFFTNPKETNWLIALNAPQWNVGKFSSQCQVEMGIAAFFQYLDRTAKADRDITYLHTVEPRWKEQLTEAYCWQLVYLNVDIMQAGAMYMDPSGTGDLADNYHHVAFHIRRGDHKYINCDNLVQPCSQKRTREKTEVAREVLGGRERRPRMEHRGRDVTTDGRPPGTEVYVMSGLP